MSISLVILRIETAQDNPTLKEIEYSGFTPEVVSPTDREASPSEWPLLVTDRLLAIHRGQREPSTLTVTTLDETFILEEMAALNSSSESQGMESRKGSLSTIGGMPRMSSKDSTPGPSSSKEGTPGPSEDGCGRRNRTFKESLSFISGNPMVDVTKGILHLFKENTKKSTEEGASRSEMLCMLAVPTSMLIHDLLQFTAACYPQIQHMRVIRDSNPNQYMVLIKFRSQADADVFYTTFNGQPFNSFEPDICNLVYVARVETTSETEQGSLPIPGHTELPTCPVCLERMDESVDGILTILCNHSFHGECLAKWGDTSCPVCRFCQTPDEVPEQKCLSCGASDSLWICLICGHVGCGRYVGGHAHNHFMETNHLFALQVGNNRVWDYVRDNYVHRLLQSDTDGKVVSYEPNSTCQESKNDVVQGEEKLTSLQLEYTHLLSSQLETQREFFETKIAVAQSEANKEVDDCRALFKNKTAEVGKLKQEFNSVVKEKQGMDKKMQILNSKLNKVSKDLETEKQFNVCLREGKIECMNIMKKMESQMKEKDEKIIDLENQVRDIMMHLETMNTISSNPELAELQGGQIGVKDKERKLGGARRKKK